jgi:RNA polymerase sigma factor (sigma-70 family)
MTEPQAPAAPTSECESEAITSFSSSPGDRNRAEFVERLFERHGRPLMSYLANLLAHKADAEDVLQETYARLLKVDDLDTAEHRARAYLFKIATNLAYDRFQQRKAQRRSEDAIAAPAVAPLSESPEHIVDLAQGVDIIKKTLRELTPRRRRVFLLRASEGLSYEAIAERLGASKRTVEREMKHTLEVCQQRLKRYRE